ncbi:hypothetical protein KY347_03365 [Candidatus Woesearchaeota archaeon]|nr:hypothetical protein [Candidatus Woesearchaeota archaeon]
MIKENVTNRVIIKNFLEAARDIIAENTSFNYSVLAINGIKEQLSGEFKFLKKVYLRKGFVDVGPSINDINRKELKKFLVKAVERMGPDYLKVLLTQRLAPKELAYLETLGMRFG